MSQHRQSDVAHIVRRCKLTAMYRCQRFGTQKKRHRSARTCTVVDERMNPRPPDYFNSIVLHAWFHSHTTGFRAAATDGVSIGQWLNIDQVQTSGIKPCVPPGNHLAFMLLCRVVEQYLEQKTIELG